MAGQLRFDGRVAVITGAGNGIGRQYALQFAERGAKCVVNDLGTDTKGGGKGSEAADRVVAEIRQKGGVAVANYDSIEDGEAVVETALRHFGRIDILVNNAGILRDRTILRMTDDEWDAIHNVHMRGYFRVTRAALPHMKKQRYGRIIMTSSNSGLYGNYGQANYAAAKMGVVGLGLTVSLEGAKDNIKCNIIAPLASTRLTDTAGQKLREVRFGNEDIAPAVLYLCHESCPENGSIFEIGAKCFSKVYWQKTKGLAFQDPGKVNPEMVRDNWDKVLDTTNALSPKNLGESMMAARNNTILQRRALKRRDSTATKDKEVVTLDSLFNGISKRLEANPHFVDEISTVFKWVITKDGELDSVWTMDTKHGKGSAYRGEPQVGNPDVTLTLPEEDFIEIATGELTLNMASSAGRLMWIGQPKVRPKLSAFFSVEKSKL